MVASRIKIDLFPLIWKLNSLSFNVIQWLCKTLVYHIFIDLKLCILTWMNSIGTYCNCHGDPFVARLHINTLSGILSEIIFNLCEISSECFLSWDKVEDLLRCKKLKHHYVDDFFLMSLTFSIWRIGDISKLSQFRPSPTWMELWTENKTTWNKKGTFEVYWIWDFVVSKHSKFDWDMILWKIMVFVCGESSFLILIISSVFI